MCFEGIFRQDDYYSANALRKIIEISWKNIAEKSPPAVDHFSSAHTSLDLKHIEFSLSRYLRGIDGRKWSDKDCCSGCLVQITKNSVKIQKGGICTSQLK